MTLKFFVFRAVVKVRVSAKFHRAKCSGSWGRHREKKLDENNVRRYRGR